MDGTRLASFRPMTLIGKSHGKSISDLLLACAADDEMRSEELSIRVIIAQCKKLIKVKFQKVRVSTYNNRLIKIDAV